MESEKYNLQYGDIIQIDSPSNSQFHEKIFLINFIDFSKIVLLNQDITTSIEISEQGKLLEESIDNIISAVIFEFSKIGYVSRKHSLRYFRSAFLIYSYRS